MIFKLKKSFLSINYKIIYDSSFNITKRWCCTSDHHVKLDYCSFSNIDTDHRKEPLIMMHGLFGYRKNFESIAKTLAHTITNPIYTVDLRNHGNSARHDDMSYEAMSRDVDSLLVDELNIDSAIVLGHSMGGKVAMMLALNRPSLVSKLVVVDITQCSMKRDDTGKFAAFVSAIADLDLNSMGRTLKAVKQEVDISLKPIMPEKAVRMFIMSNVIKKNNKFQWKFNISAINKHLNELMTFPKITEGITYDGTTKFIGGANSQYISESSLPAIHRLFPFVDIEMIQGAGHWVHSEKPYEFIDIVARFVNGDSD